MAIENSDDVREKTFVEYFLKRNASRILGAQGKLATIELEIHSIKSRIHQIENGWFGRRKRRQRLGACRTNLIRANGKKELVGQTLQALTMREHYRRMCAIPRVRSIEISENILIVITDILYGKDRSGTWHNVGSQEIKIDMCLKSAHQGMRWKNLTHQIVTGSQQGPPNINFAGSVSCFGDATDPLKEAFDKEDWETIVAIAVRYPECSGSADQIKTWPVVDPESVPRWYLETFVNNPTPAAYEEYEYG